ncbi:zinc ribbon domain-containing protein [uncultured Lactobacillus sp.]|uniref:zinc ribbon domain-containing protein n=1 Tax=uncultured Lactobacillus sp. TaxID=153152 RepID=UPI0026354B0A|nr:zinc ribbon domain-containing protein [uncultured Lactobacillus sp.]
MKCPNCGADVRPEDEVCPHCNFDLKKFRSDYSTITPESENVSDAQELASTSRRSQRFQENTAPKKQNGTVAAMIQWINVNSTIVFLVGIGLLILMSFSRPLGWFTFFALMVWLFVVCDRHPNTEQYTADKRLTEHVNKVGSDVLNSFENTQQKVAQRRIKEGKQPISQEIDHTIKEKRSATQLGVVLMAALSLVVVFYGPFSSSSMQGFQSLSISKMLLSLGGLGGKYILIGYGLWLALVLIPIAIIVLTIRNKTHNRKIVFILSLIETILLLIAAFELIFMNAGSVVGISATNVTSNAKIQKMMANAISFGVSAYLLLISSILTTIIAGKSLKNR